MRREDDAFAGRAKLQAVVDIVEVHRKAEFIHAAKRDKFVAPRQQARRGHGAALMRNPQQIGVTVVAVDPVIEGVRGREVRPKHDAAVLNHAARP